MDLHVFFLPFLAPGHMIPMVDLARLFASRGVKATVVTTAGNVHLVEPTVAVANSNVRHPIQLLSIPFPAAETGLPESHQNLLAFNSPAITAEFAAALERLEVPFVQLLEAQRPDCIVADVYYPWATRAAEAFGIPRLAFHGSNSFISVVVRAVAGSKLWESEQPFVVPGVPHRMEMRRSQLPLELFRSSSPSSISVTMDSSYGVIVNSFHELEGDYINMYKESYPKRKSWYVGPFSLQSRELSDRAARGNQPSVTSDECLKWLDAKEARSVLYVCFGSLARFTAAQLREIASGLAASGHPFVWVLRHGGDASQWVPEGFEEEVAAGGRGRGLVINGWAPQLLVLNHEAVGGFMTHCGWNSCVEGACAGVPMATWPLFAEQFFNERLMVDVLGVGVGVGAKVWSNNEEERELVKGEEVERVVKELMGSGEEAEERRRRATALGEAARRAVDEGGSSHADMTDLIQDLVRNKAARLAA